MGLVPLHIEDAPKVFGDAPITKWVDIMVCGGNYKMAGTKIDIHISTEAT